jgi:hypothetical protein
MGGSLVWFALLLCGVLGAERIVYVSSASNETVRCGSSWELACSTLAEGIHQACEWPNADSNVSLVVMVAPAAGPYRILSPISSCPLSIRSVLVSWTRIPLTTSSSSGGSGAVSLSFEEEGSLSFNSTLGSVTKLLNLTITCSSPKAPSLLSFQVGGTKKPNATFDSDPFGVRERCCDGRSERARL